MALITKRNGSRHWNSKLTEDDIDLIFKVHIEYLKARRTLHRHSPQAFAESIGKRNHDFYYDVINGKHRPRLPEEIKQLILDNEAKRIELRKDFRALAPENMAPKFDISPQHWRDIVNGKYWKYSGVENA